MSSELDKQPEREDTHEHDLLSRFPTAYTILFALIAIVAALTWVIPAG
ncbi:hypothetical protein [Thalassospira alkalitolerans]